MAGRARAARSNAVSPLEMSVGEIKNERPEISYDTLSEDANAVQASLPAIRYTYSKLDLDYEVAEKAAIFGWKQLRLESLEPTTALSPAHLINFVSERGVLVIKSTPIGATIELDGTMLSEKTEAVEFPSPGNYRVRLSLPGYESVEEECKVTKDKKTEFDPKLKPLPKKKP
ncbi:MAG: PEGA domain-containing protein [Acidobacteriota bacterium]|nr:PEGA domain-containing protein [Acidobacteriota bacterium]